MLPDFWGNTPYRTLTGIGVTWLYGIQFEIKVIAKLPGIAGLVTKHGLRHRRRESG